MTLDQQGRTIVVTGANSGFGLVATRELARRGAHVVMAVRDLSRGEAARTAVLADIPDAELTVRRLDLFDLDSVREFADATDRVDVLINNAGIGSQGHLLSAQGVESTLAVNHLGHFALTALLLDRLTAGHDPRVVTVASGLYRRGRTPLEPGQARQNAMRAYNDSKLANVLFAVELQRRLTAAGSPVTSVAVHPGMAGTAMHDSAPAVVRPVTRILTRLIGNTVEQGAAPLVEGATGPVPIVGILGPDRRTGVPRVEPLRSPGDDVGLARRLWTRSEELSGVRFPITAASERVAEQQ